MKDELKPKVDPGYSIEKFDGEVLLYAAADAQAVYLNDTAYAVWLLCKEDMNVGQMIAYLEEVYPDQKEQIRHDVVSALEVLQGHGVIEFADA